MNIKNKKIATVILLITVLLIGVVIIAGCRKKTTPATAQAAAEAVLQKTCPITGKPVDQNMYTTYKGKKVYFCCPGCKPEFEKDPEKYIAKLPQFKE